MDSIESALKKVDRYLNDRELLKRVIEDMAAKGKGPLAILQKITVSKGETKESAWRLIQDYYPEEEQIRIAQKLVLRKGEKDKAYRFLLSRGFSHAIAVKSLHVLGSEEME